MSAAAPADPGEPAIAAAVVTLWFTLTMPPPRATTIGRTADQRPTHGRFPDARSDRPRGRLCIPARCRCTQVGGSSPGVTFRAVGEVDSASPTRARHLPLLSSWPPRSDNRPRTPDICLTRREAWFSLSLLINFAGMMTLTHEHARASGTDPAGTKRQVPSGAGGPDGCSALPDAADAMGRICGTPGERASPTTRSAKKTHGGQSCEHRPRRAAVHVVDQVAARVLPAAAATLLRGRVFAGCSGRR